jgi:hypothetical protein
MIKDLAVFHFEPFAMASRTKESCYVLIVVLCGEDGRSFMIFARDILAGASTLQYA